jgi:hypothetical protein
MANGIDSPEELEAARAELNAIFSDDPPERIYFSILVEYNKDNPVVFTKVLGDEIYEEFSPIATYPEAAMLAREVAKKIMRTYKRSKMHVLPLENCGGHFNIRIVGNNHQVIAKLGVIMEDYRREAIQ